MTQEKPVALVGIYHADGGFLGEAKYFFGHLLGLTSCELCSVTHSPIMKKASWKELELKLKADFNLEFDLLHLNERDEKVTAASEHRTPCVLAKYSDGSLSMLIDKQDLQAISGSVEKFERALRARLLLFF
ncbi:MAG: hypothetical protein RLZZ579_735 [Actinomycetota bacterium]|jgi:hypothetical protein